MSNDLFEDEKTPAMTPEDRQAAIDNFLKNGGKIKKCPTRVADESTWLGGRPNTAQKETNE